MFRMAVGLGALYGSVTLLALGEFESSREKYQPSLMVGLME
jgi:hypothetical protein